MDSSVSPNTRIAAGLGEAAEEPAAGFGFRRRPERLSLAPATFRTPEQRARRSVPRLVPQALQRPIIETAYVPKTRFGSGLRASRGGEI